MYNDEEIRKAHNEDFKRVLARVLSEGTSTEFRISRIKECIRRTEDASV